MAHKRHYTLLLAFALAATACVPTDAVAKQTHHAAVKAKHHAVAKPRHHAVVKTKHRAVVKTKDRVHRVRPVASAGISFAPAHALSIFCDHSLWSHVYAGDPRRFSRPQDRLQIIQNCVSVTGTIESARPEKDGDFHIRLRLDPQYRSMVNAKNRSGQGGALVVEPVCMNPVKQTDTLKEHVCDGFSQDVYKPGMLGAHVRVTGAYVTDMEHGWNEIHPVTFIGIE
jgi:hypothetical protein